LIFAISLVSVASNSRTFWYLRSKVEFVPRVRRTEAPGTGGCSALRLPGGTAVAASA